MKKLLNIVVTIALLTPGLAWAEDTAGQGQDAQLALVTSSSGLDLSSKDKKAVDESQQSHAVVGDDEAVEPDLKALLNATDTSSSGNLVFYKSPQDYFRVKPFHAIGGTGVAAQIKW